MSDRLRRIDYDALTKKIVDALFSLPMFNKPREYTPAVVEHSKMLMHATAKAYIEYCIEGAIRRAPIPVSAEPPPNIELFKSLHVGMHGTYIEATDGTVRQQ